jgi:hypothetical protein
MHRFAGHDMWTIALTSRVSTIESSSDPTRQPGMNRTRPRRPGRLVKMIIGC